MILLIFPLFIAIVTLGWMGYLWTSRPNKFGFVELLTTIIATSTVIHVFGAAALNYLGMLK